MAPSISSINGTWSHGSSVIISGSGFLTKSPAAPLVWADFEEGVLEESPLSSGTLLYDNANLFTVNPRSRSVYCIGGTPLTSASSPVGTTNWGEVSRNVEVRVAPGGANPQIFGFCRRYYSENNMLRGTYGGDLGQYKVNRMGPNTGESAPDVILLSYINMGNDPNGIPEGILNYYMPEYYEVQYYGRREPPYQQWFTEEFIIDCGTYGEYDASAQYWENCNLIVNSSGFLGWSANGPHPNSWFCFQNYYSNYEGPSASAYAYFDDVYLDNTLSRVMLGNANTYDDCTIREPQIPSAWSTSSITATVNLGGLASSGSAWLYVVDSTGEVSSGEEITINAGESAPIGTPILSVR